MIICKDNDIHPLAFSESGFFDPPVKLTVGNYVVRSGEGSWDIEVTDEVEITSLKES